MNNKTNSDRPTRQDIKAVRIPVTRFDPLDAEEPTLIMSRDEINQALARGEGAR